MLSLQASQALFRTPPRTFLVAAVLAAYLFGSLGVQQHLAWWVVTLTGLVLLAGLQYLGYRWLERDVLREAQDDSAE